MHPTKKNLSDMKKLYTLALCAFVGTGAMAQNTNSPADRSMAPNKPTQNEIEMSRVQNTPSSSFNNREVLYYEDFSNGFDGSLGLGGWQIEDTGEGDMDVWMMATADSPQGQFTDGTDPLNSETADNGWVVWAPDHYNTEVNGASANYEDLTGFLTSPTFDFSEEGSVLVTWDQYFRYCCVSSGMPLGLEVSNDGGQSWVSFEAHGDFIPNANQISANPEPVLVDISCAAANESEVLIRWAFNSDSEGFSTYFWGIDDIEISTNENANDMAISQVTNGDVFEIYEFRVTPMEQAIPAEDGGLLVGTMFSNNGFEDQENVTISVEILDDGGDVVSLTESEPFTLVAPVNSAVCPGAVSDTMYMETGWVPESVGNYTVRSTIIGDATDATPDNNVREIQIVYTAEPGIYGHELPELHDAETTMRESEDNPDEFEPEGWGNAFTFVNDNTTVWGTSVRFGETTDPGAFYRAQLIQFDPTLGISDASSQVVASRVGEVSGFMIPTSMENSIDTWLLFDDPSSDITTEDFYFLAVFNSQPSTEALTFYGITNSDTDFSSGSIDQSGTQEFVWFLSRTFTPAIRLITDEFVSVDEISTQNGFQMGQNHPNPAVESTKIPFNLDQASDVRFEVYDLAGKLVKTINEGQVAAGNQFIQMDVNDLDTGIYTYTMIVDGKFTSTKKMVVQ